MADSNKEICKWLERIADQLKSQNRLLKQMADNMEQKQFDEFDPPAVGTAVQNMRGCVMLNAVDFEALVRETDAEHGVTDGIR